MKEKYITIKGKQYLMRVSFMALLEFERLTGKTADNVTTLEDTVWLMFAGLKAGAAFNNIPFDLTYDDIVMAIDADMSLLTSFKSDKGKVVPADKEEGKKKLPLTKH